MSFGMSFSTSFYLAGLQKPLVRVRSFEQESFECDVELFAAARAKNPSSAGLGAFAPAC